MNRLVGQGEYENGFTFGEDLFWVGAACAAAFFGKIIHRAVHVSIQPVFENRKMRGRLRRSNASQDKP